MQTSRRLEYWLSVDKVPPVDFWRKLAGKQSGVSIPSKESWKAVWKNFKSLYFRGVTDNALDSAAITAYFKVEWEKNVLNSDSALENRWYKALRKKMRGIKIFRHAKLPETELHLDFFCPQLMLAFEVQGEQHWRPVPGFGGIKHFTRLQESDARKRKICKNLGIKLIELSRYSSESVIGNR